VAHASAQLLVANRSEIAISVVRATTELGISSAAVYAEENKLYLHRFKADEAQKVGKGLGPIGADLSIPEIIRVTKETGADAIHPGYGFFSESPKFAEARAENCIVLIGPSPETMRVLGNEVAAHHLAEQVGVPVVPATRPLPEDRDEALARQVGFPVMLKASRGGGGRMRAVETAGELAENISVARREAKAAFGKDEAYPEKIVRRARHVGVQFLGGRHGTVVHPFERDCSTQRRGRKALERAPPQSRRGDAAGLVRRRAEDRPRFPLLQRRHRRVPDGCRDSCLLLHRDQPAQTLVIRPQTVEAASGEGEVKVFFELSGQPRIIRVPDRSATRKVEAQRKAEPADPRQVAAPMPGVVATLAVAAGQQVKAGDVLISIEAMKMETALHAERDGTVKEIFVRPGQQIDAKDLVMTIA
jgi:pyruvate carboxylase